MAQVAKQIQTQKQIQKISQRQIYALSLLSMSSTDLSQEIYRAAAENPALEIVYDPRLNSENYSSKYGSSEDSANYLKALENISDKEETLQAHLLHQLNSMNLSQDEMELSKKLIYNLDKNGFYGSSISPGTFLDKTRPAQNSKMLEECIKRIQQMDPVGTCCKTPEESLLVQAQISKKATPLSLFILDGHIDFINPPEILKIQKKLIAYRNDWAKKSFAKKIILNDLELSEKEIKEALDFILTLNPHPAMGYQSDENYSIENPDVVLTIEKKSGSILNDDFSAGLVAGDEKFHFQVKYASGDLPQLRISESFKIDKENVIRAQNFIKCLLFRESTIVLQGCAIVKEQKAFFLKGPEHLKALTRRKIAALIGVNESTVSRTAARKNSKYFQTEFGLLPASYFFPSGIKSVNGNHKISSEKVKIKMQKILEEPGNENLSDSKLCELLNKKGAKISRRTVSKYRNQLGIKNSYKRK
ncbi:MAG: hypothetical protein K6A89_11230 [Treponema sp.]|nr:hypothetical protein [Treponema sp.]